MGLGRSQDVFCHYYSNFRCFRSQLNPSRIPAVKLRVGKNDGHSNPGHQKTKIVRNHLTLIRKTGRRTAFNQCGIKVDSIEKEPTMFKKVLGGFGTILAAAMLMAAIFSYGFTRATAEGEIYSQPLEAEPSVIDGGFSVEVLINGVPATEYAARSRCYIEAFENAEYELRIHNPSPTRVAVALAVGGLNTIDARHTSAWGGPKRVV